MSAATHLAGAAVFLVLGARLLRRGRGAPDRMAFLGVYVAACVLLLLISGTYHVTTPGGAAHRVMLRLDYGAIFVLIAGTFTPIHGLLFRGALRWGALGLIWAVAAAGVIARTAYFGSVNGGLGLGLYLAMGWLGAVSGGLLCRRYGYAFVRPLLWGGVVYSAGAIAHFVGRPVVIPGFVHAHELFHLAVLAGALLHYQFVWQFAGPRPADEPTIGAVEHDARRGPDALVGGEQNPV